MRPTDQIIWNQSPHAAVLSATRPAMSLIFAMMVMVREVPVAAKHEYHRDKEHLVALTDLTEPGGNSQHCDTGEQLVGSAEHAPDLLEAHEAHACSR